VYASVPPPNQPIIANRQAVKDVHKAPPLDLVAIFTLAPPSGPLPDHVPILQQLQHSYNDSLMLLLFHPQTILDGALTGGKLPISIYESYYEPGSENADKGLQVDGWSMGRQLQMRFRQLPFEVETGEAEMIAVDFVAKGSGSATVHNSATPPTKAKGRAEGSAANNEVQLSVADEEGNQDSYHFEKAQS
jgi:COP9 signalosome complex subunit 6